MSITQRQYQPSVDFDLVSHFLIEHYQPMNRDGNWFQPTWEYMNTHAMLDASALNRIGIWEEHGKVVGVVTYESTLGEAFFQIHPDYPQLKPELLAYAEQNLAGTNKDGRKYLYVYVNDFDTDFTALVQARGYAYQPDQSRAIATMPIPQSFEPDLTLPAGFKLKSLADDNNLMKVHRVLWRGFNSEGEPPIEGIEERRHMQSGQHYRKDLTIVVEAPNGDFASFAGLWYDPKNLLAYVEPVATDPTYRRMGLGRAAVLEGIRRCSLEGARQAFVGNDLQFYLAMGFKVIYHTKAWFKYLD
jgi:GNAT superfamily N-acetyltransferase